MLPHVLMTHQVAPVAVTHARGATLFDEQGRSFVDFEAGIWCMALGYGHPRVQACVARQSERVMHLGPTLTGPAVERAAAALLGLTPHPDGKALFLSSGSEAMEMAIRLSLQVTGRSRLLSLRGSYLGAYGLSGRDFVACRTEVDFRQCGRCVRDACSADCPVLADVGSAEDYAAFVWEPVLASGGILEPPAKLVRYLAGLVQAAGGLAVVDEVTTGLGRTAAWWGFEHAGAVPDVIACGKALGNGYPVSAVAVSVRVAGAVEQSGYRYAQSHQNDPLAAVVAYEVLSALADEGWMERASAMGDVLGSVLREVGSRHPAAVVDVRGRGLMWGLELRSTEAAEQVWAEMLQRGFLLGIKPAFSLLRFLPPLVITPEEIGAMGRVLDEALAGLE